jgi:hypothetical protein
VEFELIIRVFVADNSNKQERDSSTTTTMLGQIDISMQPLYSQELGIHE